MTLPDFIKRMLGFTERVESHFTAAEQLTQATARVQELESELAQAKGGAGDTAASVVSLTADLEKAKADLAAATAKVGELETALAAEKGKTTETLAGMGVPAESIPAAGKESGTDAGQKLMDDLAAITNPVERTQFYRKNESAIKAASASLRAKTK